MIIIIKVKVLNKLQRISLYFYILFPITLYICMAPYFLQVINVIFERNRNKNSISYLDFFLFNGIFVNGTLNTFIIAFGYYYKVKRINNYVSFENSDKNVSY